MTHPQGTYGDFEEPSDRELSLTGVAPYWAEGAKGKPHARRESVEFVNSDSGTITVFLTWLDLLGAGRDRLHCRVMIHESADVDSAERYRADLVGIDTSHPGQDGAQEAQPENDPQKRERDVSRLPRDQSSPKRRVAPSHRGHLVRHSRRRRSTALTKCPAWTALFPCGVIGSTVAFGAICPGSSPGGGAKQGAGPDPRKSGSGPAHISPSRPPGILRMTKPHIQSRRAHP